MKKSPAFLHKTLAAAICAGLAALTLPAGSALASPLTTLNPGRVETPDASGRRVSPTEMPGTLQAQPGAASSAQPLLQEETPPTMTAPAGATFHVNKVILDGATSYPPHTFQPLLATLEGRKVSLAEVNAVAERITQRYRKAGFVLVRTFVPVQRLDNGVLRLRVIEGQVNQVTINGPSNRAMERYAENIRKEVPLKGETLERNLLLMNDISGNETRGTLVASQGKAGTDLAIDNQQRRWEGFVGIDNRDSRYFGPWQMYGGVGLNDPFDLGDHLAIRYGRSLEGDKMSFYEGQYELPIRDDGTVLSVLAQHNDGNADTLSFLNANSNGDTFAVRVIHPWIRSRDENFRTSAAFTWFNGKSEYLDNPDLPPSSDDRIRAIRLGAAYDFTDRYGGANLFKAELSKGLGIMGASDEDRLNPSRFGGETDFVKVQFDAQRIQDLSVITDGLNLYLAFTGQTAFGNALLTPEQFGVGGSQFGRGYDPSEIAGDNGLAGKVELQYNRHHEIADHPVPTQYYGFWDVGKVWNNDPDYTGSESLSSAGLGIHFEVLRDFYISPEVAFPLTRKVSAEELDNDNGKAPRLYLNVLKLF
ncbi:Heme/hemopexin transporter protein HuxB [compost metagenome]